MRIGTSCSSASTGLHASDLRQSPLPTAAGVTIGQVTEDDVALIGNDAEPRGRIVSAPVHTRQIAPSILQFLGLKPDALNSVRIEETAPLP